MDEGRRDTRLDDLLDAWEATYKKGQLTLWVLMALRDRPRYADEIRSFVEEVSAGTMGCEPQSLYRLLRKFQHLGVLVHETRAGDRGPDRKYHRLTPLGEALFERFVQRNIAIFHTEAVRHHLGLSRSSTQKSA